MTLKGSRFNSHVRKNLFILFPWRETIGMTPAGLVPAEGPLGRARILAPVRNRTVFTRGLPKVPADNQEPMARREGPFAFWNASSEVAHGKASAALTTSVP